MRPPALTRTPNHAARRSEAEPHWYTGTVYTNPAYDPRRADDPGDLGVVVLDQPEKLPLLLTVPGRQSGTLACPLLGACGGPQRVS